MATPPLFYQHELKRITLIPDLKLEYGVRLRPWLLSNVMLVTHTANNEVVWPNTMNRIVQPPHSMTLNIQFAHKKNLYDCTVIREKNFFEQHTDVKHAMSHKCKGTCDHSRQVLLGSCNNKTQVCKVTYPMI